MLTRPAASYCSLLGLLGLLAVAACIGPEATANPSAGAEAQRDIAALVGDAACTQDSDCQTQALPDQACGGPQGWLAYSTRRTDKAALQQALQRWAATGPGSAGAAVSTCGIVADPGAVCARLPDPAASTQRSCQLRPRGASHPLR